MKEWHEKAHRMRLDGHTILEIVRVLGKSDSTVRWVLDEDNERQNTRERVRARRNRGGGAAPGGARHGIDKPAQRQPARSAPARPDYTALAQAWVAGEFSRDEFFRRMQGQA